MNHSEVFVQVLLSQVSKLRKNQRPRAGQAADQDATGEEARKSHLWRAGGAIAPDQCKVRWLSKGDSA